MELFEDSDINVNVFLRKLKNKINEVKINVLKEHTGLMNLLFLVVENTFNNKYFDKNMKKYIDELEKNMKNVEYQKEYLNVLAKNFGVKLDQNLVSFESNEKFVETVNRQLMWFKDNIKIPDVDQYAFSQIINMLCDKTTLKFKNLKGCFNDHMLEKVLLIHNDEIEKIKKEYNDEYHQELLKVIQMGLTQIFTVKFEFQNSHKEIIINLLQESLVLHVDSISHASNETLIYHIMTDYFLGLDRNLFTSNQQKNIFIKVIKETFEKHTDNLKNKLKPTILTYDDDITEFEKQEIVKQIVLGQHKKQ
jgi:hypothetical protein